MIQVLFCVVILACATPLTIDPNVFGGKDPVPFEPKDARSQGVLNLQPFWDSLTRMELANCIANLPIAEDVRQILVHCAIDNYPSYLTAHDEVGARHADRYIGICRSQAERFKTTGEFPSIEQVRERDHEADVVRNELLAAELGFINLLQDCLDNNLVSAGFVQDETNIGAVILEPLSLKARRRSTDTSSSPRGDSLDLRYMVNRFDLDMPTRRSIEAELLNYERALAALKPAQCKAYWQVSQRMRALMERRNAGSIDEITAGNQAENISAASARIGVQVRKEALAAVAKITPKLPAKQQKEFERRVYKEVFPELADDRLGDALRAAFAAAAVRTDLSRDTVERIASLQQSWILEYDAWRTKAEAALLDWSYRNAIGEQGYETQNVRPKIAELLQSRSEMHENWRMILTDQLPSGTQ